MEGGDDVLDVTEDCARVVGSVESVAFAVEKDRHDAVDSVGVAGVDMVPTRLSLDC